MNAKTACRRRTTAPNAFKSSGGCRQMEAFYPLFSRLCSSPDSQRTMMISWLRSRQVVIAGRRLRQKFPMTHSTDSHSCLTPIRARLTDPSTIPSQYSPPPSDLQRTHPIIILPSSSRSGKMIHKYTATMIGANSSRPKSHSVDEAYEKMPERKRGTESHRWSATAMQKAVVEEWFQECQTTEGLNR